MKKFILPLLLILAACSTTATKEVLKPYKTTKRDGKIEIRLYEPAAFAGVEVEGSRAAANETGYRVLTGYIMGGNSEHKKITMTKPVFMKREDKDLWLVSFVMPLKYERDDLPEPKDEDIVLRESGPRKEAVIKFTGALSDKALEEQTDKLREYLAKNKIATVGKPLLAQYSSPWVASSAMVNEIHIGVR